MYYYYHGLVFNPFMLFYGSTLMIFVMLAIFLGFLPIFVAKTRNIPAADITVVKILSWTGLIIHLTWIIGLLIACFREPEIATAQKDKGGENS
ncbi:MAG: hypothetical protein LBP39_02295 [Rickettsiales bacterium]|jgi:hypothetical protein|nr:hypothetical protein [Rickettsiales bacterium]